MGYLFEIVSIVGILVDLIFFSLFLLVVYQYFCLIPSGIDSSPLLFTELFFFLTFEVKIDLLFILFLAYPLFSRWFLVYFFFGYHLCYFMFVVCKILSFYTQKGSLQLSTWLMVVSVL